MYFFNLVLWILCTDIQKHLSCIKMTGILAFVVEENKDSCKDQNTWDGGRQGNKPWVSKEVAVKAVCLWENIPSFPLCFMFEYWLFLCHIFGKTLNVFNFSFSTVIELFHPAICYFSTKSKIGAYDTAAGFLMKSKERSSIPNRVYLASNGEAISCVFVEIRYI